MIVNQLVRTGPQNSMNSAALFGNCMGHRRAMKCTSDSCWHSVATAANRHCRNR